MKSGPIIVIDNDIDDQEVFEEILESLETPNKLISLNNCADALAY